MTVAAQTTSKMRCLPGTDVPVGKFFMNILNAMAVGIVVALIPNAVLGGVFKYFVDSSSLIASFNFVSTTIQFGACALIGFLAGTNFNFGPLKSACLSLVGLIACGNIKFVDAVVNDAPTKALQIAGIGDILNVLLALSIACYLTQLIGNKFGSLLIVLQPIVISVGAAWIGYLTLPYVSMITTLFAQLIERWTELQPMLMCTLIAMAFSFAVSSPLSSVALALITGVDGLASGAANVGVSCAATYLIVTGWKANKVGVPVAIFFGAIKMMLPNMLRKPQLFLPMLVLAAVSGFCVSLFGVMGDKSTAGFGYISLIGPIKAYSVYTAEGASALSALARVLGAYVVVPVGLMLVAHFVLLKVGFYKNEDFKFGSN